MDQRKVNQTRGLALEHGLIAPKALLPWRRAIPGWLENTENGLKIRLRQLPDSLWHDLLMLDDRVIGRLP